VLSLEKNYEDLHALFSTNAKRNIKRAYEHKEEVVRDATCEELLAFKRENDLIKRSEKEYQWLLKLLKTIEGKQAGQTYAIRKEGKLIAAAFFAFSRTRGIYLVSASSAQGKEQRSMFQIVDSFIREQAGSGLLLDFEGSNIPSVARFFSGFGARPEIYQGVSFDRLPVLLNKLRKRD
jgi:lipid II:glycine glycyltransferase (peptidoglycan interpeptide bridge formation enzyme)